MSKESRRLDVQSSSCIEVVVLRERREGQSVVSSRIKMGMDEAAVKMRFDSIVVSDWQTKLRFVSIETG